MRITPYGYRSLTTTLIFCSLAGAGGALLLPPLPGLALSVPAVLFFLFSLWFYRDPERQVPEKSGLVLAPADGTIVLHKTVDHPYTGQSSTLVSIFMSPFNVHVNRIPCNGHIVHLQYHPGQFLMAFDHRSMSDNERMETGLENGSTKILFSQVSGFVARRIVNTLKTGETVKAGSRFGMIKFGSRVDIYLSSDIKVEVSTGMKTLAGETVLGHKIL